MKRVFGLIGIIVGTQFIVSLPVIAEGPDTLWTKTYGGTGYDWGKSVQECAEGGFIIAGYTQSFGVDSSDVYLIRTDADGDTLWTKTYGGTNHDWGYSVQECASGGFIIAGVTWSFGAGWADVYLIRTDADGDTLWTKTYGGTNGDFGYSVQECTGGGFIIAGGTWSFGAGDCDIYLVRTNADGDTLWTKTYGGTDSDWGESVQECANGGFIIAGETKSFGAGSWDVYLIRTNADGDTLWTQTYGGTDYDYGESVQECANGGFIIAGTTRSFGAGSWDVYLIRTDTDGDTLWTKTYGGSSGDWGYSVQECAEGGFIIAGTTWSRFDDVYLIRTNADGDTLWIKTYGGGGSDYGYSVQECASGGFIIAGETVFGAGYTDVYLIRTSETGVEEETGNRHKAIGISLEVYPNPCFGKAVIHYTCPFSVSGHEPRTRITIYDISGRLVKTIYSGTQEKGYHTINVGASHDTPTGIYFIRLEAGKFRKTKKLTILR
ncbi:T9SS type A sorting domain-containing protein [candidate division WOR-3 bacterium]|nr:T9SS type A sorting domain-containing protein [candidate division WOR-3 bacterium]